MSDAEEDSAARKHGPIQSFVRVRRSWRRLSPFFRSSRGRLVLLVIVAVVAGVVEAGLLALIATMAAALSTGADTITQDFGPIAMDTARTTAFVIAFGMALARAGLQVWLAHLPAQMSARVLADLRNQLFDSFVATTWSVKSKERDGAFQMLMTQSISNTAQAVIGVGRGLTAMIMFLTMVVAAFLQSVLTAAILTAAALLLFLALRPLSRTLRGHARRFSAEEMEFTNAVQQVVQIAEETEVFGASAAYRSGFQDRVERVRRPYRRTRFLAVAVPSLYQSIALLLLVVGLIGISVAGVAHLAVLAAVILLLLRSFTYAQQIQHSLTGIDERVPFMNQLVDALSRYSERQDVGTERVEEMRSLALSEVSFAYQPGHDVLHDVSFDLHRGEAIGIVGPSGAGKSSIVQILLRLRPPRAGAVLVDGRDARKIARTDWQSRVAYVPQTSQIIWANVRENIRFYRDWIDDDQVVAAAKRARIHEEIMAMPEGYDTHIGQRASAVSGGQGQRICLARALAGRPQALVLDEPTSALDVRSEELVQKSLEAIKEDTITVLVAHRLSTLSVCDRIVVLDQGRVTAVGTHADLLERSDFFREVNQITNRQRVDG